MASTSTTLSLTSTSTLADSRAPRQPTAAASLQSVNLSNLHTLLEQSQNRSPSRQTWKTTAYCRKLARNVITRDTIATGDTITTGETRTTGEAPADVVGTEASEILKTVQEAWDKLEDKYAVTLLAFAGVVGLFASFGTISAIDRLPIVPGVLELVGIGYSGWFAYKNLVFKPDREALIEKIKDSYKDILGSSS